MFAKRHRPAEVLTPNRLARWRAAWAYEQGVDEVSALLEGLDDEALETVVPACPDWSVGDLLAHLVGVAEDSADGGYFADAMDAWRTPASRRLGRCGPPDTSTGIGTAPATTLVGRLSRHGSDWAGRCAGAPGWSARRRHGWSPPRPPTCPCTWPTLREALGQPAESGSAISRFGFAAYRQWLRQRLVHQQLPALLLSDGRHDWPVGRGDPAGTVTAPADELFRMITGRRSRAEIRRYDWTVDPTPYLAVISPYPLPDCSPASPLEPPSPRHQSRPTCPHQPTKGSTTMSTTTATLSPLAELKAKQQLIWSSGDYNKIAAITVPVAESLVVHAEVGAGDRVLDVATGTGHAALAAARRSAVVTGIDYVPRLVEIARRRAAAEDLDRRLPGGRRREPALRQRLLRHRPVGDRRDVHRRSRPGRRRAGPGRPSRRTHRSGQLDAHRVRRADPEDRGPARPAAADGPVADPLGHRGNPARALRCPHRRDQPRHGVGDPTVRFAGRVRRPLPQLLRPHPHGGPAAVRRGP